MIETAYIIVGSAILLTIVLRLVNEYDLFKQFGKVKKRLVQERFASKKWREFIDSFASGEMPIDHNFM